MSWCVGTLRTSTWKVRVQTVKRLVGKVLTSTSGKRQLTIITGAERQFRSSQEYKPSQAAHPVERERDQAYTGLTSPVQRKKRRAGQEGES